MEEKYIQKSDSKVIDINSHRKKQKNVLLGNSDKVFYEAISESIKRDFSEGGRSPISSCLYREEKNMDSPVVAWE